MDFLTMISELKPGERAFRSEAPACGSVTQSRKGVFYLLHNSGVCSALFLTAELIATSDWIISPTKKESSKQLQLPLELPNN